MVFTCLKGCNRKDKIRLQQRPSGALKNLKYLLSGSLWENDTCFMSSNNHMKRQQMIEKVMKFMEYIVYFVSQSFYRRPIQIFYLDAMPGKCSLQATAHKLCAEVLWGTSGKSQGMGYFNFLRGTQCHLLDSVNNYNY